LTYTFKLVHIPARISKDQRTLKEKGEQTTIKSLKKARRDDEESFEK